MGLLILMTRPHLDDLPPLAVAPGYRLATAAEFENPAPMWAQLINRAFTDQNWSEAYIEENFRSKPQYDPHGVFFVMHGESAVSTAFAWLDEPGETQRGRIHWVGALPEHRGKGLGRAVVLAVMHYFRERGFSQTYLETHPPMLPAISLYLSLGLEPTPRNPDEEAAWAEVMKNLGR